LPHTLQGKNGRALQYGQFFAVIETDALQLVQQTFGIKIPLLVIGYDGAAVYVSTSQLEQKNLNLGL